VVGLVPSAQFSRFARWGIGDVWGNEIAKKPLRNGTTYTVLKVTRELKFSAVNTVIFCRQRVIGFNARPKRSDTLGIIPLLQSNHSGTDGGVPKFHFVI
jgi:hypothetical protein